MRTQERDDNARTPKTKQVHYLDSLLDRSFVCTDFGLL